MSLFNEKITSVRCIVTQAILAPSIFYDINGGEGYRGNFVCVKTKENFFKLTNNLFNKFDIKNSLLEIWVNYDKDLVNRGEYNLFDTEKRLADPSGDQLLAEVVGEFEKNGLTITIAYTVHDTYMTILQPSPIGEITLDNI
jgi:hypothetical protein